MMALYAIRALEGAHAEAVKELVVEAPSEAVALDELRSAGMTVLSIEDRSAAHAHGRARWRSQDLSWWCRELRTLLIAGMTVVEALETLQSQARATTSAEDRRQQVQRQLLERLRQGEALSVAMEHVGGFPPVLMASVRSAERTSALGDALEDYLRYHEVLDQLRRRVISAAMYPMLVCGVGFLVCGFLLIGVLPRFAGILESSAAVVGGASGMLIGLSRWLSGHWLWALGALVALALVLAQLWRAGVLPRFLLRLAGHLGPVARALRAFELAKLYQAIALLFRGGYPLEEALDVCRRSAAAEGNALADRLHRSQQALLRGQGVARALDEGGLTDEVSRRLLAVGERSGGFGSILQVIAQRHAQTFGDFVDRLMRVIEPVLLLLVASAIGAVVVLMYLPIFDIATGLQS